MSGFKGIKKYQDFCRRDVMEKGFILLNPLTGHKAFIYDYVELRRLKDKFKEPGFWDYYREMKVAAPTCDTVQDVKRFFKRKSASEKQSINYRKLVCGLLWQHSMKKWKNCWEAKYLCICQSAAEPHSRVRKVQRLGTLR